MMRISAIYVCPIRGLARLEPPEPVRLGQAVRVAKGLGLERLWLPVLEEPLVATSRVKVAYLDGLVRAMDKVADAGLQAWLMAPAQSILGLYWAPPYLVKPLKDPIRLVFVDGQPRNLRPLDWWKDPFLVQKRIRTCREVIDAIHGHPALTGWCILDRALDWPRPEPKAADLVLKSFMSEIQERDETGCIYMGLDWSELLDPETAETLVGQVDGIRLSGLERWPSGLEHPSEPTAELLMAVYLGTLSRWLFGRPTEIEIGWGLFDKAYNRDDMIEAGKRLAGQGLSGGIWLTLVDPEPRLHNHPPWALYPGLQRAGLLDHGMEPKGFVEPLLNGVRAVEPKDEPDNFIDLSREAYVADPNMHLARLWDHFWRSMIDD